jgi:hypothetical protein
MKSRVGARSASKGGSLHLIANGYCKLQSTEGIRWQFLVVRGAALAEPVAPKDYAFSTIMRRQS